MDDDDNNPPGGYASWQVSAAVMAGLLAVVMVPACLLSAYREALEFQYICTDDNCVVDARNWFERHPGMWGTGLLAAVLCLALVAWIVGERRAVDS